MQVDISLCYLDHVVVHVEQVGQQVRPGRVPAKLFTRQRAGYRKIDHGEVRQLAEVLRRLLWCDRLNWHLQPRADHLGDVALGNTFLTNGIAARSCLALLERQPVRSDVVGNVHCWQAVIALADIRHPA